MLGGRGEEEAAGQPDKDGKVCVGTEGGAIGIEAEYDTPFSMFIVLEYVFGSYLSN